MGQTRFDTLDPEHALIAGHYYMDSRFTGLWVVQSRDGDDATLRNVDTGQVVTQPVALGWGDRPGETCEGTPWFDLPHGGNARVFAHRHVGGPGHEFAEFRNRHSYIYCALYMGNPVVKVTVRRRATVWVDPWDHSRGTTEADVVKLGGSSGYHEVGRDVRGDEEIWLGEFPVSARNEVEA